MAGRKCPAGSAHVAEKVATHQPLGTASAEDHGAAHTVQRGGPHRGEKLVHLLRHHVVGSMAWPTFQWREEDLLGPPLFKNRDYELTTCEQSCEEFHVVTTQEHAIG